MTWVLIAWCTLIVVWAVAGANSATQKCMQGQGSSGLTAHDLSHACSAGAGVGVLIVLFIGFVGFCFFALIWFMSRPRNGFGLGEPERREVDAQPR